MKLLTMTEGTYAESCYEGMPDSIAIRYLAAEVEAQAAENDRLTCELTELRERDRVLSKQLERRASGRDPLTAAIADERDALLNELVPLRAHAAKLREALAEFVATEPDTWGPDVPLMYVNGYNEGIRESRDMIAEVLAETAPKEPQS